MGGNRGAMLRVIDGPGDKATRIESVWANLLPTRKCALHREFIPGCIVQCCD